MLFNDFFFTAKESLLGKKTLKTYLGWMTLLSFIGIVISPTTLMISIFMSLWGLYFSTIGFTAIKAKSIGLAYPGLLPHEFTGATAQFLGSVYLLLGLVFILIGMAGIVDIIDPSWWNQ